MRLEQLTLRELRMKLIAPFETSMETTTNRRVLLTEVVVDGVVAYTRVEGVARPRADAVEELARRGPEFERAHRRASLC